ncbi:type VI secretion system tube protein TssD [Flavobacterium sp. MC2016-06]|jgi:hypothetical protein|uniref:type VI secretion system tube protein TssD n=1 Tax=Flavobacterium sp. MC2016-06 TaxID=2676308 RepID=UPI0012BA6F67|nr:type VI secretion system tube protein TssD [Flavobacterium sp. MC2016-06]MBU3859279.1 hypothetical protein [Flavobacterium sp. MC2016-06]
MAVLGILKLDNKEYKLITYNCKSTQAVDKTGKPSQRPSGLQIDLTIESDSSTDLLQWALGNEPKDGIITFYKADGMSKFSEVKFKKAHCINLTEKFEANGILPMRQLITISEPRREEVKEVIAPPKRVIQTEEEKTEDKTNVNGYFYNNEGIYLGKIGSGDNVYITDKLSFSELEKGNNVEKEKIVFFTEKYELNNNQFLNRANWVFGEGGGAFADRYAMTIKNLRLAGRSGHGPKPFDSDEEMYTRTMSHGKPAKTLYPDYLNGIYKGANAQAFALAKRNLTDLNKNNKMNSAIKAVINSFAKDAINEGYVGWRGSGDKLYSESEKEIENKGSGTITKDPKLRENGSIYGYTNIKKDHYWEAVGKKYRRHSFTKIWYEKI